MFIRTHILVNGELNVIFSCIHMFHSYIYREVERFSRGILIWHFDITIIQWIEVVLPKVRIWGRANIDNTIALEETGTLALPYYANSTAHWFWLCKAAGAQICPTSGIWRKARSFSNLAIRDVFINVMLGVQVISL